MFCFIYKFKHLLRKRFVFSDQYFVKRMNAVNQNVLCNPILYEENPRENQKFKFVFV